MLMFKLRGYINIVMVAVIVINGFYVGGEHITALMGFCLIGIAYNSLGQVVADEDGETF